MFKAKNKFRFETPLVEMSENMKVTKDIKADGEIADHKRPMQADRNLYNQHDHGGSAKPSPLQ
ncbi:hypothetical protein [Pseudomonas sp. GM60]|uniref:hypothetical protein n=1 Tax=Pseudomonas sp. GM60 TaxID=1144334 RepID=UPI0003026B0F|nr:hypothetical protein [Pseudomonas sp. GM60]